MSKKKEVKRESEYSFSQREQKLKVVTKVGKEEAIKKRDFLKTQIDNAKKTMKALNDMKALAEKKESLPYFKEIQDVLKAEHWSQNRQAQAQLIQIENDIKRFEEEYKELKRVLPAK